jgi:hypothetical protein
MHCHPLGFTPQQSLNKTKISHAHRLVNLFIVLVGRAKHQENILRELDGPSPREKELLSHTKINVKDLTDIKYESYQVVQGVKM